MSEQNFDDFTRRAAPALSRRQSLMALGGATLAAVTATPSIAEAKKNKNKKARKKARKKAKKKCQQQVQQCINGLNQINAGELSFCCQELSTCDAFGFIQCLANSQ